MVSGIQALGVNTTNLFLKAKRSTALPEK